MKKKLIVRESKAELVNPEIKGTPAILISQAVAKGADLEKLEKLLALQERYETNEARKAYHKAMADFKTENIKILKDAKVDYETKTGGRVKFKHASLFNVVEKITPLLSKYGLSISWRSIAQDMKEKTITIACIVTHILGHSEEFSLSGPSDESGGKNPIQAIGSASAYLERYTALMAFGLATKDQDDDGQASGKPIVVEPKPKTEVPPKSQPPKPTGIKCHGCDIDITQAEKDYSMKKFNKPLCRNCQRKKF